MNISFTEPRNRQKWTMATQDESPIKKHNSLQTYPWLFLESKHHLMPHFRFRKRFFLPLSLRSKKVAKSSFTNQRGSYDYPQKHHRNCFRCACCYCHSYLVWEKQPGYREHFIHRSSSTPIWSNRWRLSHICTRQLDAIADWSGSSANAKGSQLFPRESNSGIAKTSIDTVIIYVPLLRMVMENITERYTHPKGIPLITSGNLMGRRMSCRHRHKDIFPTPISQWQSAAEQRYRSFRS